MLPDAFGAVSSRLTYPAHLLASTYESCNDQDPPKDSIKGLIDHLRLGELCCALQSHSGYENGSVNNVAIANSGQNRGGQLQHELER